jgi:4-hydroxy-3-methylbut-2-enyl diphosphate reductase
VQEVIERLAPVSGVEHVQVTVEDEYFPPPPELRELLRAVGTALGVMTAAPKPAGGMWREAVGDDRDVSAADVLELLAG